MSKKVMLIDGSSLIFRAFFALPNLTNADGVMTNGVYGFLTMYFKAVEEYKPDYILVAFDKKTKTFRHKEFEDYKANRDKAPNELNYQFGILKDILDSLNVRYLDIDGYEADDIVGTFAKIAKDDGLDTVIITGDKDYFQLVNEKVVVYLTRKGISQMEEITEKTIKEEYGLSPKQLIDVKGLMGDKSDNIPGVDGIGEKRAIKFIQDYGSMESLYENLDEISGKKTKENLENSKAIAFLSKKIGTIVTNAPVEIKLDDIRVKEPDLNSLKEKFSKYNFNKFLEKFEDSEEKIKKSLDFSYEFSKNYEIIDEIQKSQNFYFKTIYDGENYIHSKPLFIAIKSDTSKTYIYDLDDDFVKNFKDIFEDKLINKVSFDIKEDIVLLNKIGINVELPYDDVMLMHYLIDPSRSSYDIKALSQVYLKYEVENKEVLLGKGKKKKLFIDLNKEILGKYMASTLNAIEDSKDILISKLTELTMFDLYKDCEIKLSKVLSEMEIVGFVCKKEELEKIKEEVSVEIKSLEDDIYELAGSEFNINSTKQLGKVLFEDLDLPIIKKTKTGFSTDAKVLERLRDKHEIIPKIEKYRELFKLKSTYLESLEECIDEDGRIRSTFKQNVTATGRLSSTEPNLQNLPIRTDEGRKIRKAFKADEGKILVDADYSQIELRVLAHLSDDKKMQDAFSYSVDIHTKTASEVFNTPINEVTKLQRSEAKAVNFGIIYGISDYGLSQNLNIPRKRAKEYIDNYLNTYPQIKEYMKKIVDKAKEDGFVKTIFNRRRYVPEINSKNFNVRSFGQRVALNTPIQGSAADIIKYAMIKTYENLKKSKIDAKIILQIHDEIILEVGKEDENKAKEILEKSMQDAADLKVPLLVDIDSGDSMYESK
ncbi:DNA polymerase I [Anaerococcus sp. AGMB00486]|uniref:DNA polymerase I n=2 Tax=Anaerococcus TaxID=165779 RepID=A0ABX2N8G8_9FIRM|nr:MULTISPECIES: DNA polymerase I [Anaerococcus]MSS77199.1 DNA polymerase I [Anaerococcus porci]NVF10996.1 DNA polymerase I [Anaerococcus faecalis]